MTSRLSETISGLRARHGTKLVKFGAVSAFNVIFGQALLYGAQVWLDMTPVAANTFSVSIGAIPAYLLSRYWVWEKKGPNHLWREIVPFWTLAILGFVISTTAVWFVDARWAPEPWVINLTSLAAYGVVWVSKFVIFDRFLFGATEEAGAAA